ncbi:MAG: hypothetical protein HC894_25505 [Microcoleus sp. SM1_3_4]|nr:hypothetical protein [Microcoleus sp. SM1_3_4]
MAALKDKIISRVNPPASLGQSWLVWGQLTADDQDVLETAKNCYSKLNLFPNAKWEIDLQTAGKFLGADVYELWCPPGDRGNIEQNYHVLICLFPYNNAQQIGDISNKVANLYPHLLQLFLYRNKVISSYTKSRQLKANLKEASRIIKEIFTQLPLQVTAAKFDLKQLQQTLVNCLTICSMYAQHFSALEEQENTIKTHLENYKRRLEIIGKDMGSDAQDFKFMAKFSDFARDKYIWQMEADNRSLSPNLRLLENAIETIEGIIEIERAKSDRALNVTIGAAGVGIATSGVVASTYASQIKSPASDKNTWAANDVFALSIGSGIVLSLVTVILLKIINRKRR